MTNICETATQLWDVLSQKQRAYLLVGASVVGLIFGFWLLESSQRSKHTTNIAYI